MKRGFIKYPSVVTASSDQQSQCVLAVYIDGALAGYLMKFRSPRGGWDACVHVDIEYARTYKNRRGASIGKGNSYGIEHLYLYDESSNQPIAIYSKYRDEDEVDRAIFSMSKHSIEFRIENI